MNCRSAARILPGMAAGDVDAAAAAEAQEHIRGCPACAAELAGYEEAMAALGSPRAMIDVPESLSVPRLPNDQPQRRGWLRPALAAALAAAGLGLLLLAPGIFDRPRETAVAPQTVKPAAPPPVVERKENITKPPAVAQAVPPVETGSLATRRTCAGSSKRAAQAKPSRPYVQKQAERVTTQPESTVVEDQPSGEDPPAVEDSDQAIAPPIIVIASWVEPPGSSNIEIESVDHRTGTVIRYVEKTKRFGDVMEITTTLSTEQRGVQL